MLLRPNAKINLGLNVVSKRPDGYHNLETVFYPIPLTDRLELQVMPDGASFRSNELYKLTMDGQAIAGSEDDNLVVKALKLLDEQGYSMAPVEISLTKQIPSGAGLGGGSADAAFMLKALNEIFHLQIPTKTLEMYAARLGADCAIFIQNKPVYAEGIGNLFTDVDLTLAGYYLVVIKPDIFISTKAAFSQIKPAKPDVNLLEVIRHPVTEWKYLMKNDFEESVFPQFPEIAILKKKLYDCGALYASMSGSGSSLYGLFPETQDLQQKFPDCFYTCLPL